MPFTLPAYLRALHTHTSGVLTRRLYSHTLRVLVVLAVSVTPGVVSSQSFHTSCMVSLFSMYPSGPACSSSRPYSHALRDLIGLLTRLAWARCSRGICHTPRGIVAVFSHTLRGLIVLVVFITPGVVSSWSSHTPCVGSLFLLGLVVAAPVHEWREIGLWREIIDCAEKESPD